MIHTTRLAALLLLNAFTVRGRVLGDGCH
ncbi:leu operon leader peptide [Franconibacter daqui]